MTLTRDEWNDVVEQWEGRCAYCGITLFNDSDTTMDHIIPMSKGGAHSKENVVPACRSCNSGKKNKELHEWRPATI